MRPRWGSDTGGGPLRLAPRSALAIVLASAAGLIAFGWPLILDPGTLLASSTGDTQPAPLILALLLPMVLAIVLAEVSEGGLDVKAVAMLGVLSAVGAVLRPLGPAAAGIEVVFFLLILAGRVFGPGFGFVLGTTTLFASALITAGVGPHLPYQMIGAAWVGMGAGLLPRARGRTEILLLAGYGALAAFVYGLVMNFSFWPFATQGEPALTFVPGDPLGENLRRFVAFTLATSMGWDLGRAITNVTLILLTGPAVLSTLRRASRKAAFDAPVEFTAAPRLEGDTAIPPR